MNKLLIRLCTVTLSLGMLGAAACSGCMPPAEDASSSSPSLTPQSMTCGAGTRKVGNQCVADGTGGTKSNSAPGTLGTNGNN